MSDGATRAQDNAAGRTAVNCGIDGDRRVGLERQRLCRSPGNGIRDEDGPGSCARTCGTDDNVGSAKRCGKGRIVEVRGCSVCPVVRKSIGHPSEARRGRSGADRYISRVKQQRTSAPVRRPEVRESVVVQEPLARNFRETAVATLGTAAS